MSKQEEAKFKAKVQKDLECAFGDDVFILATQELARKGVLDLIICLLGDYITIELKLDGEKPTPLQNVNLLKAIKAGGRAFFSTPTAWPQHLAILEQEYLK